ncbi:MAG: heme NO-binding protein [Spirulina sp. SIO3F2]|nr:heme NO-binding protein [Spirulina sp. SIO3F2]
MYGLVNKAIEDMVRSNYGEETWQEIKQLAQIDLEKFVSMEGYPDDVTHRLVKAASQVLSISPSKIMEAFGAYWVQYTAQEGYGELLDMSGDDLPEFLENLDNLHARVSVSFPKLSPPSFECEEEQENALTLHYHSQREGLAPMVIGLIEGLGERFETEVKIQQTQDRNDGFDHDSFSIEYKDKSAK